ncbi:hypothetical protein BCU68_01935 [Vibrio sp. 10N.286.49.B3]|uniref:hypothetical protein n=1 Tax=Vibrio sp. 10N.286.49.B3 TaxID=1880855 RepID=UPI000C8170E4|nr:hypothetical protein [Vibrio sp. 10N.286.49.B3]PMH46822.1 hypothetical protein BCU68_01935 [Vibrio sp. 10N.286.49.B3]
MQHDNASTDIVLAAKTMLMSQCLFGVLAIAYEIIMNNSLSVESSLIGVVIAIIPALFGMYIASRKVKYKPNINMKDLMHLSRNIKLVYTVIMFVLAFKFMALSNTVVIEAYCITFIGYFIAPMINKPVLRTI